MAEHVEVGEVVVGAYAPPADGATPVDDAGRIAPIDVLRGVAVLGILLMNVQSFGLIGAAYVNPTAYGDFTGANWWTWAIGRVLVDQKIYGVFAMLFGAGIVLMTSRVEARGLSPAKLHYRRMAWLALFGMLHAFLIWSGDILYTYALCGAVAYRFRHRTPRALIVWGMTFIVVGAAIWLAAGLSLPFWPAADVKGFELEEWRPTAAMIAREIAAYGGSWSAQTSLRVDDAIGMETYIFALFVFWKTVGLMLVGMALFKTEVFSATRPPRFYWRMIVVGTLVGASLSIAGIYDDVAHAWDVRYAFFQGDLWNYWGSFALAFAWVAAIMLLCRSSVAPRLHALGAAGRMAFTNYILQSMLCTTLFGGQGLALFARLDRVHLLGVVASVWGIELALSTWWLARFRYGPLEWLWRSLTYGVRQPMRRVALPA